MSLSLSVAAARRSAGWAWFHAWQLLVGVVLGGLALAIAAWLALHWLILPRLDDWRGTIEAQASRALGHPVQIGQIAVHSSGWVPAFVLREVVLRDAQGRVALRLPQVSAALSVPHLLALRLRFEQLLIDDAKLDVRRDAQGRWHVAGLGLEAEGAALDASAVADWFFQQHEFVIRRGELRWIDEQRAAPPLQLSDVLLVVRNRGRRHELRLDATPPPDWGQRFSLRALARSPLLGLAGRPGDWQRWKGSLYADLPQVDLNGLRRHVDLPLEVQQGQAALRAWVDWDQGLPRALTLDAALRDASVRLAPTLAPLVFAELGGRFVAERSASGVTLVAEHLAFDTGQGPGWAPSRLKAQWRQTQAKTLAESLAEGTPHPVTGGEFEADRLDLAVLAGLSERLPIGDGLRSLLYQLNPEGVVHGLKAGWDGPLDAPTRYQAQARVLGLAIAAAPSPEPGGLGRPGWFGADLDFSASETGGQAQLTLKDGAIELPGVFELATVPLANFGALLKWRIDRRINALQPVELVVQNAHFDNADARGVLQATWHRGAGSGFGKGGALPGVLLLNGTLTEGRAARVARYLPLALGEKTRRWVQHAVLGGELRDVVFRVQGDLWAFPYANRQEGDFRIAGKVVDLGLAPVPSTPAEAGQPAWTSPWPAISGISGELVFERNAMQFRQASGRLWGLELAEVQGRIRELSEQSVLELEGQARGPAADLLRYVQTTPLDGWTGHALDQASIAGAADLDLALTLPLARLETGQAKAVVHLPGNDVRLRPDLPPLPGARGRVEATTKGVQITALRTQLAGGDAQIDGGTQADGSLRFAIAGTASADGLRRSPELGALAALAQPLQGQAAYRLLLGLQAHHTEWQLASNLQGMAINLPAPLAKAAESSVSLRVGHIGASDAVWLASIGASASANTGASTGASSTGQAGTPPPNDARRTLAHDWLRAELGPLQASLVIDRQASSPRLVRSAWAYHQKLPEPTAGGSAALDLPRLDIDAWRAFANSAATGASAAGAAGSAGGSGAGNAIDSAWLPQVVTLKTPELLAAGRRLTGVSLALRRLTQAGSEGWQVQGEADQAAGQVDFLAPRSPAGAGRVLARLARLSLPPAEADTVADSMAGLLDRSPTSVPALDIEIEAFELRGRQLGRLTVQAVNRLVVAVSAAVPAAPAPATSAAPGASTSAAETPPRSEWRLDKLLLDNGDAKLAATGRWLAQPGRARRHMALDFTLDIEDSGALLQRLGKGKTVQGAKGKIKGNLGWDGSPLDFDIPTLEGRLALAIERGKFLKADAGAARLLGVLSLQALPRRLLLDFRDLFEEGFAFDTLAGDVWIQRGVAGTDNLRMRGQQAVVLMAGSADIARETQDMRVVAVPELHTASASLAYAAVNPAVALGAFVGQWLLSEPLRQASAREFHITGGWDDPKVERVERSLLAPLPASPVAPAAAGTVAATGAAASAPDPAPPAARP